MAAPEAPTEVQPASSPTAEVPSPPRVAEQGTTASPSDPTTETANPWMQRPPGPPTDEAPTTQVTTPEPSEPTAPSGTSTPPEPSSVMPPPYAATDQPSSADRSIRGDHGVGPGGIDPGDVGAATSRVARAAVHAHRWRTGGRLRGADRGRGGDRRSVRRMAAAHAGPGKFDFLQWMVADRRCEDRRRPRRLWGGLCRGGVGRTTSPRHAVADRPARYRARGTRCLRHVRHRQEASGPAEGRRCDRLSDHRAATGTHPGHGRWCGDDPRGACHASAEGRRGDDSGPHFAVSPTIPREGGYAQSPPTAPPPEPGYQPTAYPQSGPVAPSAAECSADAPPPTAPTPPTAPPPTAPTPPTAPPPTAPTPPTAPPTAPTPPTAPPPTAPPTARPTSPPPGGPRPPTSPWQ